MADLPSILGGMAQGFVDFGKGVVDMFGTGGAAIGDLIEGARTGKVTTKNQDDFRKWLYQTDSTKDAAAKGLGTTLNGVQTVLDYIPGVNVLTRNPLGNAAQGALGGLADEFKTYGENYDLGRAGQRAAVSGAAAAASGSLADALKGSSNALLSSNTLQGLARGATGGAITGGGYAAIDGGDVLEAAKQGAGMGALIGGATGAFQDFRPAKTYDVALTDDERAARIANAQKQIDDIGPIRRFTDDPNELAKRARVNELQDAIKAYQSGYDTVQDYNDALATRRANRQPSLTREEYEAKMQQRIRDLGGNYEVTPEKQAQFDRLQKVNPMRDDYHTGIRAPQDIATLQEAINNAKDIDPAYKAMLQKALADDSVTVYSSYPIEEGVFTTPIKQMAQDYAGPGNQVYSKTISPNDIAWIDDQEGNYIPRLQQLETTLSDADMAVNSPKLTPEQEAYFKDSVIRDENGNLMPMYHGTRGNFTVFGDNAPSDTSNSHASVGNWFTPTKEGAKNFAESIWYGDGDPRVMETYLNVKNPKIYETVDNSKAVEALTKELREMELNSNKLSDTELYSKNIYDASMAQRMLEQEGKDTTVKWLSGKGYGDEKAAKLVDEIAGLNEQAAKKKDLLDKLSELKYSDAYQRFKTDIYKMDGQTAEDANVGGTGMALNDRGSIKKYVDKLKSEGYDGIIIKGTRYDADTMGGPNDQYVVFDSNQIKDINNLTPTDAPSIMESRITPEELDLARALANQDLAVNGVQASKIVPGQLGLFDDMPTQTPKTGTRQTSLFDQPQDGLDYYGSDIEMPIPENGLVSRDIEDLTQVPIDANTLPKGWLKARELADMGKRAKQIVLDPNAPNRGLNEYNMALYSDAQYGRNNPVADIIDRLGSRQLSNEIDRGAARLLADQLDESGDDFAKNFVTGAAEVGGNIGHYKDAPKARQADQRVSELLNIGRSSSMLSDSLAKPTSRNALGDQWKGTINIKGNNLSSGGDDASSVLWHERMHAFQDAEKMGYDKRVVDAYNDLREDLAKLQHDNKQILRDHGEDAKYWGKPIEQEARMAQHYLDSSYGVDNLSKVYARDSKGKIIRVDDNGQELDPSTLHYYTGKPVKRTEYAAEDKQIKAAFDKFIGKLQKLSRQGVALPALAALFGGGAYMASQENDKEKEVK